MTLDFLHTVGDSYQFLACFAFFYHSAALVRVPLLLSEVRLQAVLNLERDGSR